MENNIFGPTPLSHSATGSVSIPVVIAEGKPYDVIIEVHEITFQPIPPETCNF